MREFVTRHPLLAGILFQAALIPLAFLLAVPTGITLHARLAWSAEAFALGVLAALPMLALVASLSLSGWAPFRELSDQVRGFVHTLFARSLPGAVLLISLLAGVGEELLVRGVLQGWLAGHWPAEWAILAAALVFGLAHAISRLYFVFATLIGLYLGWVYHLTDNLLVVAVAHAIYDWIVIRLYLRQPRSP
ncbi:MAG: CPBP family intramembrane glutamic endopeptidase [Pseudomonadota bacterium]